MKFTIQRKTILGKNHTDFERFCNSQFKGQRVWKKDSGTSQLKETLFPENIFGDHDFDNENTRISKVHNSKQKRFRGKRFGDNDFGNENIRILEILNSKKGFWGTLRT